MYKLSIYKVYVYIHTLLIKQTVILKLTAVEGMIKTFKHKHEPMIGVAAI